MPTRETPTGLRKLGQYALVRLIGRGAFTEVYEARDTALGRTVAVKSLTTEAAADADLLWRFYTQATAAARLVHPNILQIFFVGEERGAGEDQACCYCAMEYVAGGSLEKLLARAQAVSLQQVLQIGFQILNGLAAIHRRNLVHGDLTPSNVLIDQEQGRVLLADFGAVGAVSPAAPARTTEPARIGTRDRAPELLAGKSPDARSDLYSAGALIASLLTCGQVEPRSAPAQEGEAAHRLPEGLPERLVRALRKLLEPAPANRFQSAEEALAEIEPLLASAADQPKRMPAGDPQAIVEGEIAPPPASRPTTLVALPPFEVLPPLPGELLRDDEAKEAPGLVGMVRNWFRRATPESAAALQGTELALDDAVARYERRREWLGALCREAESVLVELQAAEHAPGKATSRRGESEPGGLVAGQKQQLAVIREKLKQLETTLARLRSERDALKTRLQAARAQIGPEATARPRSKRIALFGQLALLAVLIAVGAYVVWQTGGAGLLKEIADQGFGPAPDASPPPEFRVANSQRAPVLSWVTPDKLAVPSRHMSGPQKAISGLSFLPGRKLLVAASEDGGARLCAAETGEEIQKYVYTSHGHSMQLTAMAASPDGRTVALASSTPLQSLILWDAATGQEIRAMEGQTGHVRSVAFSPDGRVLAAVHQSPRLPSIGSVRLWDAAQGTPLPHLDLGVNDAQRIAFSPTQPWLACCGMNSSEIVLWDINGRELRWTFSARSGTVAAMAFSPDGLLLSAGTQAGRIEVWELSTGAPTHELQPSGGMVQGLAFSPDRRHLAVATPQAMSLWDISSNQAELYLPGRCSDVAFSEDGKMLAVAGGKESADLLVCDLPPHPPSHTVPGTGAGAKDVPNLKRARFLAVTGSRSSAEFGESVAAAGATSTPLPVSLAPDPAEWHETTLNTEGVGFDVLRFSSSLAEPADALVALVETDKLESWDLISAAGGEQLGIQSRADDVDLPELALPHRNSILFEASTGGKIAPRVEYYLWFLFKSAEPVDVRLALRLRPAEPAASFLTLEQIGQAGGFPSPLPVTGYSRGAHNMAQPPQRDLSRLAPGYPYDRNSLTLWKETDRWATRFRLHP